MNDQLHRQQELNEAEFKRLAEAFLGANEHRRRVKENYQAGNHPETEKSSAAFDRILLLAERAQERAADEVLAFKP